MIHRVALCLLALALLVPLAACAEAAVDEQAVIDFACEEQMSALFAREEVGVRALYRIALPEDAEDIPEALTEAYGGYADVRLIEFSYATIPPILESAYACVGLRADGTMAMLDTPFDLVARTYDPALFEGATIEALPLP